PTYMRVVFTASKFGDYFEGGEGSLMYVDDVEIVYEKI
ncbi:MAG: PCMD domain-containing protein, partial [Muribaculaceae bacterium]|nr:PCMD domain-containing protein [Muribaculaceae bacterium]